MHPSSMDAPPWKSNTAATTRAGSCADAISGRWAKLWDGLQLMNLARGTRWHVSKGWDGWGHVRARRPKSRHTRVVRENGLPARRGEKVPGAGVRHWVRSGRSLNGPQAVCSIVREAEAAFRFEARGGRPVQSAARGPLEEVPWHRLSFCLSQTAAARSEPEPVRGVFD